VCDQHYSKTDGRIWLTFCTLVPFRSRPNWFNLWGSPQYTSHVINYPVSADSVDDPAKYGGETRASPVCRVGDSRRRSETLLMTTAISSGELVACCYLRQWGYVFNACLRVCVTSITQKRMEGFGWHFARWYHLGQGRTDLTFGVPRRILPMWEIIPFRRIRLTILLNTAAKREHRRSVGLATAGALAEVCTLWALSSSLCCACVTFKKHDGGKVIDFGTKNRLDHADKCRSCHTRVK